MEFQNGEYIKVVKPYICDINACGLRFRYSVDLEEHLNLDNI